MKGTVRGEPKHHPEPVSGHRRDKTNAFTRVELLVVLLVIAGLACVVLPALGASTARSRLAHCFNNLRQVGSGFQSWSMDAQDKLPWLVTTAQGGTSDSIFKANAWIHFAVVSNHFPDPSVLVCPSDYAKKIAPDFNGPNGFLNLGQRDLTLSYLMGCEANAILPRQILSGDRNMSTSGTQNCGTIGAIAQSLNGADSTIHWTNLHGATGNLLFVDGSVSTSTSEGLRSAVGRAYGLPPGGFIQANSHVLLPTLPLTIPE